MPKHIDWWLVFIPLALFALGLTVLQSVAPEEFIQHLIFGLLAAAIFIIFAHTDYRLFTSLSLPLYLISLLSLFLTLLIGRQSRGAARWLPLGPLQFQPSEIVKPLLVLFFASLLTRWPGWSGRKLAVLIFTLIFPAWLIFKQPDLGSSLVLSAGWLGIIFAAGLPLITLAISLALLASAGPLFWHLLHDYQRQRLSTFLNPSTDPLKAGYNAIQAMITVGSGRLLGRGLGHGTQSHLKFLPERHTDFIFASLSEELGFLGASLTLTLFSLLLWRILVIAKRTADPFGRLICFGVFALIFFQMFINVAMNLGLAPITGVTLPLISSGGSSLIATSLSLGLVASVAARHHHSQESLQIR